MKNGQADIAIVGGGLAGGLTALALRRHRPDLSVALLEAGGTLGGNHRWSWFETDMPERENALFSAFRKTDWSGTQVIFPRYRRELRAAYISLASEDFDRGLRRELAQSTVHTDCPIEEISATRILTSSGRAIEARVVIDARGFLPSPHLRGGWQVFMGRHIRTRTPHGLDRPIIMDATVPQLGGFRFVYSLPLSADEIFVEDTYYQDDPVLDHDALDARISAYCEAQGWAHSIEGGETGILPVVTGGDGGAHRRDTAIPGVVAIGARALLAHPLTSYTLPFAAETALLIADNADLSGPQLAARIDRHADSVWHRTAFYRMLGKMLFGAARPSERYRIFERHYSLSEGLIERFYAARPTLADKARELAGKPPVPVHRAIAALAGSNAPLMASRQRRMSA